MTAVKDSISPQDEHWSSDPKTSKTLIGPVNFSVFI